MSYIFAILCKTTQSYLLVSRVRLRPDYQYSITINDVNRIDEKSVGFRKKLILIRFFKENEFFS